MPRRRIYACNAARQKAYRQRLKRPSINSVHYTRNATLIAAVAKLYLSDGAIVADVTYGCGVFWKKTDCSRFRLLKSDLHPRSDDCVRMDFRALEYPDRSADVVVLDPPYMHDTMARTKPCSDSRYNNGTTDGLSHTEVIALYALGMREAWRVLRPGGQLWVKCKDEIEGSKQYRSNIELYQIALELGYRDRDQFVLVSRPLKTTRTKQRHACKNHSYLWIFEKLTY